MRVEGYGLRMGNHDLRLVGVLELYSRKLGNDLGGKSLVY